MKAPPDIPIPLQLADRPVDDRGFAIPWISPTVDGKPAFGVNDQRLRIKAVLERLCGQCGMRVGLRGWFVCGPVELADGFFIEPHMHRDCIEYAVAVCPYLLASSWQSAWMRRAERGDLPPKTIIESFGNAFDRPDLYIATADRWTAMPSGVLAVDRDTIKVVRPLQ